MSKSNVSNGEIQAEGDVIDNNNEWKVSIKYKLNNAYYNAVSAYTIFILYLGG